MDNRPVDRSTWGSRHIP